MLLLCWCFQWRWFFIRGIWYCDKTFVPAVYPVCSKVRKVSCLVKVNNQNYRARAPKRLKKQSSHLHRSKREEALKGHGCLCKLLLQPLLHPPPLSKTAAWTTAHHNSTCIKLPLWHSCRDSSVPNFSTNQAAAKITLKKPCTERLLIFAEKSWTFRISGIKHFLLVTRSAFWRSNKVPCAIRSLLKECDFAGYLMQNWDRA